MEFRVRLSLWDPKNDECEAEESRFSVEAKDLQAAVVKADEIKESLNKEKKEKHSDLFYCLEWVVPFPSETTRRPPAP